jgi:uncharacterized protein (TIGR03086 family)
MPARAAGRLVDMTDIGDRYRHLASGFTARVDGAAPGSWDSPSPCSGWTARDVLQHVVDSQFLMPAHVGIEAGPTVSVTDDPKSAWAEARDVVQGLVDDPTTESLEYDGWGGRTTVGSTVDMFLGFDLIVHAWDLARATGQDATIPADDLGTLRAWVDNAGDMIRTEGVCGPPVEVPDDASEQDKLIAYLGRTP